MPESSCSRTKSSWIMIHQNGTEEGQAQWVPWFGPYILLLPGTAELLPVQVCNHWSLPESYTTQCQDKQWCEHGPISEQCRCNSDQVQMFVNDLQWNQYFGKNNSCSNGRIPSGNDQCNNSC